MTTDIIHINPTDTPAPQGEIVLYQPDATTRLEVRLDEETVWLSQEQIRQITSTLWASFKDLGKRLFAFDLMGIDKEIILNQL